MSKQNQKNFFATKSDLEAWLKSISQPLKYVLCGALESPSFKTFNSLLEAEGLGINTTGDHVSGDRYLIINRATELKAERVEQKKGGVLYFIDQSLNINSITFWPGGLYKDQCLICGHIGTTSENLEIIQLYREFVRILNKQFKKIGNYYVGNESLRLLNEGMRFVTISVRSPRKYNLKF